VGRRNFPFDSADAATEMPEVPFSALPDVTVEEMDFLAPNR